MHTHTLHNPLVSTAAREHSNSSLALSPADTPMHKSYQSVLPSSNRLLKKKWDDKYYDEHRLLVIAPRDGNDRPAKFVCLGARCPPEY